MGKNQQNQTNQSRLVLKKKGREEVSLANEGVSCVVFND